MKNNILIVMTILISLLICGCFNILPSIITWDETLSEEETVTIYWPNWGMYPVVYNGIDVDWKQDKPSQSFIPIIIPAGVTTLEFAGSLRASTWGVNVTYVTICVWDGISFTYDFEKGKEYSFFSSDPDKLFLYSGKPKGISRKNLLLSLSIEQLMESK